VCGLSYRSTWPIDYLTLLLPSIQDLTFAQMRSGELESASPPEPTEFRLVRLLGKRTLCRFSEFGPLHPRSEPLGFLLCGSVCSWRALQSLRVYQLRITQKYSPVNAMPLWISRSQSEYQLNLRNSQYLKAEIFGNRKYACYLCDLEERGPAAFFFSRSASISAFA
jgi:hypothetical protein